MDGWVKIYRSILTWEWYSDINVRVLFIHLLLKANYSPKNWRGIEIQAGQLVTSLSKLEQETGLSQKKIRNALKKLEKTGELVTQKGRAYTVITICNYESYQGDTTERGTPKDTRGAHEGHTEGTRGATNKNNKNNKKENNNTVLTFSEFWDLYDKKRGDKTKLEKKFNKISEEDRKKIIAHVKAYKLAQPDKQFRKDPATYLNNRGWEDEIIYSRKNQVKQQNQPMDLTGRW